MQVRSPVLLDFIHGTSHYPIAGYQIDNFVLSVTYHTIFDVIEGSLSQLKNNNSQSFEVLQNIEVDLKCYRLDGSTIICDDECRIIHACMSQPVNLQIAKMLSHDLKPYSLEPLEGPNADDLKLYFLLIHIGPKLIDYSDLRNKLELLQKYACRVELSQGQDVFAVYTPFGANEFMNTYAKGCLSNLIANTLYLVDGRLAPGCEGSPLYSRDTIRFIPEYPIGLILFPIAMKGDHSSYCVAAPMQLVSSVFLKHIFPEENYEMIPVPSLLDCTRLQRAVLNTVLVLTPGSWGTGIVVGQGLVLTNSHVVGFGAKNFHPVTVQWKGRKATARVVFHTPKSSPLDLALLQFNKSFGPSGISFSDSNVKKGDQVVAIGYPLHMINEATLSEGVISTTWKHSAGFSTSCKINAGCSGGPIVRRDGSLLGIVVGIIKGQSCSYPEINICIAASLIESPLMTYISSGDTSNFEKLLSYSDSWLRAILDLPKSKY